MKHGDTFLRSYGHLRGWAVCVLIAVATIASIALFAAGFGALDSRSCSVASHQTARHTHYDSLSDTCYVSIGGGQSVPLDNYNAFRGAK